MPRRTFRPRQSRHIHRPHPGIRPGRDIYSTLIQRPAFYAVPSFPQMQVACMREVFITRSAGLQGDRRVPGRADGRILSGSAAIVAWLWMAFLATSLLTRVLLTAASLSQGLVAWHDLPRIFLVGLLFDAVTGMYVCLPFLVCAWLVPVALRRRRTAGIAVTAGFGLAMAVLLYLIAAEFFFFDEFNARFNYVAVEYLIYPTEVLGNIRDSYPVYPLATLCLSLGAASAWALRKRITLEFARKDSMLKRGTWIGLAGVLASLSLGAMSLETAAAGTNRVAGDLAGNGVYSFFSALRNSDIDYARFYRVLPDGQAIARVRAMVAQTNTRYLDSGPDAHPLARHVDNTDLGAVRTPHVIILLEESLGSEFVGSFGGRTLTPNIDRIAADSMRFTNVYATGTRTVRGMEAVVTALPPVPPEAVVKRAGFEGLFNVSDLARQAGYTPTFVYGGYGTFDNMNAFFSQNGWRVVDRTDMPAAHFSNVWGISDEELLQNALHEFDSQIARGEHVFSLVMSTSNHKPFTYPAGVPGVPEHGGGREAGVRYADHAVGRFFDQLRQRAWYRDTVLVIVGDHGARVYGRDQIPVSNYSVPFLIHAPAYAAPLEVPTLASQIDVAPTLLGLLHWSYDTTWFGRDILRMSAGEGYALLNHNRDVALLRAGRLATLGFRSSLQTQAYDAVSGRLAPTSPDPSLEGDAIAVFQMADRLFRSGAQRIQSNL